MTDIFPWIFRSLNAYIVTTPWAAVRKPLKVLFLVSAYFRSLSLKRLKGKPTWCVINNFDRNIKLKIDRSRDMGASFFWTGFHELREFIFLHRFLKNEMTALDVGANLGEYTLFMAKRLTSGRVLSFEPMAEVRSQLSENVKLNHFRNVDIFEFGLSNKKQKLTLHEVDDGNEGLGTLYLGEKKSKRSVEVTLEALDEKWASFHLDRLDFMKVDVEGSELFVLQGGREIIAQFRPLILLEVSNENFKAAGYSASGIAAFFTTLNYSACQLNKDGQPEPCNALPSFGNVLFVPQ